MTQKATILILATGLMAGVLALAGAGPDVAFPRGYRHWNFLHSTMVGPKDAAFRKHPCEKPCTGGIYYFYGNDKAMEGLRRGKFADGSVLADELLETWQHDAGVTTEGPRRGVGVMVKDSRRYAATGGWGYAGFEGDSQTDKTAEQDRKACFQCHTSRKGQDFVFTQYRER